jgi:hypothetical protein
MTTASFLLDFTSAVLDPKVTFTRALGTATRVNASGLVETVLANTPRFNYNPVTLACIGLLIEESRVNSLTYSEQFDNASWNRLKLNTTGTPAWVNVAIAPDGNSTADKLIEDATSGTHAIYKSPGTFTGSCTLSVFAKAGERTSLALSSDVSGVTSYFNLVTGTVAFQSANAVARIAPAGNGWYRCSITGALTGTCYIVTAIGTSQSYLGDGTSGLYIWGAQFEAGAEPTSYIPTTNAALTRNADVAVITGSNFTSFWNSAQGGAQVQALPSTVSGIRPLVQYDDGTANGIIALRGNTTNPELYIVDGGTPQAQLDAGTIAANTAYSLTGWWATNDCRARKDSGAAVTDATATIPTVTQARIGSDGTNYLNGTIASINYYAAFSSQIYTRRKNKVVSSLF